MGACLEPPRPQRPPRPSQVPRAALGLAQLARMWGGYGARPKLAWLSMAQIHESKHVADPWRFRETCERLDRMLAEWLLRHVPAMRDTLLIVRGDHGIQGKMNGEFMAADEEANAFLHVLVRADLAAADATGAALHANRHAVVTALDLHKTAPQISVMSRALRASQLDRGERLRRRSERSMNVSGGVN